MIILNVGGAGEVAWRNLADKKKISLNFSEARVQNGPGFDPSWLEPKPDCFLQGISRGSGAHRVILFNLSIQELY